VDWKIPTLAATLWVIALTVLSVAVGVLVAGPIGVLIGAIPLALGTVLAGYLPSIRDAALRRREERQAAETAHERWEAIGAPRADIVHLGPAALLRPDNAIVDFTGREAELVSLRAWWTSQDAHSVRIIVGAGGVGKTRLALAVANEWEACGHEWRRVDAGQESDAVTAARGVTTGPVLLLVDYAETRTNLEEMLRAVLADPSPIRVLLVARSLGEWWDRLKEKSAYAIVRLLSETEPIILTEQVSQEISQAKLVADAVPQFARALGCASPLPVQLELPVRPVPILVLHTAALIAVLRFRDDPARSLSVIVGEGLLDELLEHESRYWRRKAAAVGLPEDGALLKPVTAVAALLGADDLADAAEIITRVPDLTDASQAQLRSWARWLCELYPADPEGRLGSLQPDLLAETHVVNQLSADPELARASLIDLPGPKAEHALTVLVRASAHHEAAHLLIASSLRDDLAHLALPAALVAIQTPGSTATLLTAALQTAPAPLDVLISITDALPYPSVALAQAQLAITQRVLDSLPSDADRAVVADWSEKTGLMLAQLGRSAEALSITEDAVAIYRELAHAHPDTYRPALASALSTLGVRLYDQGQVVEAISVTEEAVKIGEELAEANPERYRPDLAASLSNLGVRLWALGRSAEALPIGEAAVATFRELANRDPERYDSYLAATLANLGIWRSVLGRAPDALPPVQEAADIYRGLAQASPDRYLPELAQIARHRPGACLPVR
jgi:tetratricopeptide (TPR) repeat protein